MSHENLKLYSVIVGNGSGCLFQPMTEDYTYVLTAKHLLFNKRMDENDTLILFEKPDGEIVDIIRHIKDGDEWKEAIIEFTLKKGTNYFPHKDADVAILKIDYLPGFDKIYVQDDFSINGECLLAGFPMDFRENIQGDRYTTHEVNRFICPGNYCYSVQLFGTLSQEYIDGLSGGAITDTVDNHIAIMGIQSSMANATSRQAGQAKFIPIKYFNEIVTDPEYEGKLEKFLPPYFGSFSFLNTDIFNLNLGLLAKERAEKLTKILRAEASKIQDSDITPKVIKEYLREKLLLLATQKENTLQKKKIWSIWLELLTILNISKNNSHCANDLPSIFKKVRLFYSDVDKDFWVEHLEELHKLDYSGLEEEGLVVVASNVEAKDNMHILDLSRGQILQNISRMEGEFELEKMRQMGQKIDTPTDFPLKKYRYVNISAFKEKTATDVGEEFTTNQIKDCLIILKDLYARLIPNW